MDERAITCCFTGHRILPSGELPSLRARLDETIAGLAREGYRIFLSGGALGFDLLAAEAVLALRKALQLQLVMVLPCPDQAARWRAPDARRYESILRRCDRMTLLSDRYTPACMFARNREMVERSACCVSFLTRESGGTAYTVRYACEKGLRIIPLGTI